MSRLSCLSVLLISLFIMGVTGCGDGVTTVKVIIEGSSSGQEPTAEDPSDLSSQCESSILLHGHIELLEKEGECLSFIPDEENLELPGPFELLGPLAEEIKGIPNINGAKITIYGDPSPLTVIFCSGGGGLVVCSYELDPKEPIEPVIIEPICDSEDKVLSTDEVLAEGEQLAGQMVSIVGTVDQEPKFVICTFIKCSAEDPCCQGCGANLVISSSTNSYIYLKGNYEGKSVYCSGSNCGLDCYPIEAGSVCQVNGELERKERISGIIEYYLNLESFCCSSENEIPDTPPVEPEPPGNIECFSDLDCIRTGCSGEVCAPEPWITTCVWLPEYECLQFAPCACISGRCGFVETPEFLACMNAINN